MNLDDVTGPRSLAADYHLYIYLEVFAPLAETVGRLRLGVQDGLREHPLPMSRYPRSTASCLQKSRFLRHFVERYYESKDARSEK
jgi:hypothetical protein